MRRYEYMNGFRGLGDDDDNGKRDKSKKHYYKKRKEHRSGGDGDYWHMQPKMLPVQAAPPNLPSRYTMMDPGMQQQAVPWQVQTNQPIMQQAEISQQPASTQIMTQPTTPAVPQPVPMMVAPGQVVLTQAPQMRAPMPMPAPMVTQTTVTPQQARLGAIASAAAAALLLL